MRSRGSIGTVALCSFLFGGGCTFDAAADGDRIVRNPATGSWGSRGGWTLEEIVRIGEEGGGPAEFGRIVDLELDPLGRVWVADGQAGEVRVFEGTGEHVRTFGGRGGGPEEFAQITGMSWDPDGHLWIQDPGNSRWAIYDTTGTLVRTLPRTAGVAMAPWPGGFDADGRLTDVAPLPGEGGGIEIGLIRYDRAMSAADTFRLPQYEGDFFELVTVNGDNRNVNRVAVPFTPSVVWRLDPRGTVWSALTSEYRLVSRTFAGDTARVIEREFSPIRLTPAEVDEALEGYRWFTDQGGRIDRSRIPTSKPALNAFFFSDDGHLWVIPGDRRGAEVQLDVFDPQGRYLGFVVAPRGIGAAPPPAVRGDRLAALTFDSDGVASVTVLRIRR